jgi:serine/threonine protein kinase/peptidoglycan hydrolase-like protein with peptidoglycan-binding domain
MWGLGYLARNGSRYWTCPAGRGAARRSLPPGTSLQRYEILSVLGQGGFGITYRARDTQLNRDVAIKEYLPSALAVRDGATLVLPRSTQMAGEFALGRQRFVDEGRTLATLQRAPSIVRVFDFIEANGTAYIVMELVPGITLEERLSRGRTLSPAEIDRILGPLLDGLAQVHAIDFLHRDIKPANILLDESGSPTLIDFGAARAAIAGQTLAATAVFTPGYAAAEQFTAARQGPWTDIYGLSATLYHAITGAPPPSAFDRMLDETYEPLTRRMPAGFAPGLLIGIDAGLAVRASDRPQSIAGWRPILSQAGPPGAQVTVKLAKPAETARAGTASVSAPARRPATLWIGLAAAAVALAAGGVYLTAEKPAPPPQQAAVPSPAAAEAERTARAQAEEIARLQAEKAARDKADAEAAAQRQAAEDAQRKEAEIAAQRQKAEEEARQKAAADEEARRKAEQHDRDTAEASEAGLQLTTLGRQHVQVALTALGFNTAGSDGVFGKRTREMIAAWQKSRGDTATGYLTVLQNQALLQSAAPAIAKFDDDQKRAAAVPPAPAPAAPAPPAAAPRAATPPTPRSASSPTPVPGAVREEPPPGALRAGERVLVDDGTCPPDQIKEVTGGRNITATNRDRTARTRRCIARSP